MQNLINNYVGLVFKVGLILVVISTYFLFTNFTTEAFDMAKFLILLAFVGLMLILTCLKFAFENRVNLIKTPFDIPLLLLLAASIVSTIAAKGPFVSVFGNQLRVGSSLAGIACYVFFYFVLTQNLKGSRAIKGILNISIFLGAVLSVLSLAAYFGMGAGKLPLSTTGASFSTTAILAVLIPILVAEILNYKNFTFMMVNASFLALFGLTIALTGSWPAWIAALAGLLVTVVILTPLNNLNHFLKPQISAIIAALLIVVAVTGFSFIPPVGKTPNPLYSSYRNFPREVSLDFLSSWKVAVSAFRDSPFWGTGPGTFLFDFTTYKPVEFNSSKYWNIRFDSAYNEYFQSLATLGGIGLFAYLAITALFLTQLLRVIRFKEPMTVGLAGSGLAVFVVLALHSATLPFLTIALLVFAAFWAVNENHALPFPFNFTTLPSQQLAKVEALPSILLTVAVALVLFSGFFTGKFYLADLHHRNALKAVAQNNGVAAYNELLAAVKLNPWSDLYRTDLAQINFALANAIAISKAPTQASPSGSLSDQDKQNIQILLQQSITEGRTATNLSPRSPINWEILALLYRQIAGVAQNALLFSLDSYGRAIFNDPLNPLLRLNVGGVYYAVQNYDMAIRFFTDAINLKPDFANGYYNLSVALRDKGDLNGAIAAGQKVLELVDKTSPDYKTANDYLNELKTKAGVNQQQQPPAATASGQLQDQNLPKVINLPKPEKIATPEAIKASPTPTPTTQP